MSESYILSSFYSLLCRRHCSAVVSNRGNFGPQLAVFFSGISFFGRSFYVRFDWKNGGTR